MHAHFLSCDWGTSALRLRLVEAPALKIVAEVSSDEGNAATFAAWQKAALPAAQRLAFYQKVMARHLAKLAVPAGVEFANLPLVVSGMASSTIGMKEVPYKAFPFAADGHDLALVHLPATAGFRHTTVLVSGVRTDDDVMRGEEVQLVGCRLPNVAKPVLFLHPGTHAKHVTVRGGQAVALSTYMTGETFGLLAKKSILAASVKAGRGLNVPACRAAFEEGLKTSLAQDLLHGIFLTRTNDLFDKLPPTANFHFLSGVLIGAELRNLVEQDFAHIYLTGEPALVAAYEYALHLLGVAKSSLTVLDAVETTLQGHWAILEV